MPMQYSHVLRLSARNYLDNFITCNKVKLHSNFQYKTLQDLEKITVFICTNVFSLRHSLIDCYKLYMLESGLHVSSSFPS